MRSRAVRFLSTSPTIEIPIGRPTPQGMHLEHKPDKTPGQPRHGISNDTIPDESAPAIDGVGEKRLRRVNRNITEITADRDCQIEHPAIANTEEDKRDE